jgi:hypothetical protein
VITKKTKDGNKETLGIEKVTIDGEYVVALVEKDKKEGPMAIGGTVFIPSDRMLCSDTPLFYYYP